MFPAKKQNRVKHAGAQGIIGCNETRAQLAPLAPLLRPGFRRVALHVGGHRDELHACQVGPPVAKVRRLGPSEGNNDVLRGGVEAYER
jgi:hypothetical protein